VPRERRRPMQMANYRPRSGAWNAACMRHPGQLIRRGSKKSVTREWHCIDPFSVSPSDFAEPRPRATRPVAVGGARETAGHAQHSPTSNSSSLAEKSCWGLELVESDGCILQNHSRPCLIRCIVYWRATASANPPSSQNGKRGWRGRLTYGTVW